MKVFLDIGGHIGQTLEEVLSPNYGFDRVHCFEPMPEFVAILESKYAREIQEGRLTIHPVGLAARNGEAVLFGSNAGGGASLFAEHASNEAHPGRTTIRLLRATDFFQQELAASDIVLMKLNCEGAEGEILCDLAASGEIHKLSDVMVDLDLFKVRGKRAEPFRVLDKLKSVGFHRYHLCYDVMVGKTHQLRIRNWLSVANQKLRFVANEEYFGSRIRTRPMLKRLYKRVRWKIAAFLDRAG